MNLPIFLRNLFLGILTSLRNKYEKCYFFPLMVYALKQIFVEFIS